MFNQELFVGSLLNRPRDPLSVLRAKGQRPQNQQVQRSLHKIESLSRDGKRAKGRGAALWSNNILHLFSRKFYRKAAEDFALGAVADFFAKKRAKMPSTD